MFVRITLPNGHKVSIGAEAKSTRTGFKHEVWVLDGFVRTEAKVCYLNRTWESFRYQTALHKLMEKYVEVTFNFSRRRVGFSTLVEPYYKAIDELIGGQC